MTEQSRRDQILDVADRLFRHYGVQKTTIADVAREANVGVGTVYLELPSKDALIEALSQRRYDRVLDAMRAAADAAGKRAADQLAALFDARASAFLRLADEGTHACDLLHCGSGAVMAAKKAFFDAESRMVRALLEAGHATGELDVPHSDRAAAAVLRAYGAFVPPWLLTLDRGAVAADLADMHGLVLRGLLRRKISKSAKPR